MIVGSGRVFLNSFKPLVITAFGRAASESRGLDPFVDGSIRREPDLMHRYPAISCICRKGKFVPRLCIGDTIGYMTVKARYGNLAQRHRRMTAVLEVTVLTGSVSVTRLS